MATVMLAIETSQREASVAVQTPDGGRHREALRKGDRHDDDLLPAIDRLLSRCELTARDLNAVAVSIGPGGFTGLRIAVSTAKVLAETLKIDVVAVPSALVAAWSCEHDGELVILQAIKGNTCWATRVREADKHMIESGVSGLAESLTLDPAGAARILADRHLSEEARHRFEAMHVPVEEPRFDALACLELGLGRLQRGEACDPLTLLPLYPRQPEAVTLWEQRHPSPPTDR